MLARFWLTPTAALDESEQSLASSGWLLNRQAMRKCPTSRSAVMLLSCCSTPAARGLLPQSREAAESGRGRAGGCAVQRSRPPLRLGQVSELEAGADVHHRRASRMDRADDLLDIDPL